MFSALFVVALGTLAMASSQSPYQVYIGPGLPSTEDSIEQKATIEAMRYGIPLTRYAIFANSIANKPAGPWTINSILHQTALANVNTTYRAIARPGVDTLYSEGLIDPSGGDVIAMMPIAQGRFFL
ncbi:hypothetical protein B0H19DRAFT_1066634 [Mycena capillaripes]|nr:hypothetical protein B0H19DRAFT_1066634 [Mycena capillaripes]